MWILGYESSLTSGWYFVFPIRFFEHGNNNSTTKTVPYNGNRNSNYQIAEPSDLFCIFHHFQILKSWKIFYASSNSQQVKIEHEILIVSVEVWKFIFSEDWIFAPKKFLNLISRSLIFCAKIENDHYWIFNF